MDIHHMNMYFNIIIILRFYCCSLLLQPLIRFNLFDEGLFTAKLTWIMYWIPLICVITLWFVTQFIATFHMWSKPINKISSTER